MENCIKFRGKILFDPENITNKQERQSEWKKVAMVLLEPGLKSNEKGICDYYAWFIKKRFNIQLSSPIRNSHVTIVNDRVSETNGKWEEVKERWNGKEIDIYLNVDPFIGIENRGGDWTNWWLTVPYEHREELHSIRKELGLSERPYFGLHMTIGNSVNSYGKIEKGVSAQKAIVMNVEQSKYILSLAKQKMLNF